MMLSATASATDRSLKPQLAILMVGDTERMALTAVLEIFAYCSKLGVKCSGAPGCSQR